MKWQLLALWGIIFMTRYWIVKVVLSHLNICILPLLLSTDRIIFLSYILKMTIVAINIRRPQLVCYCLSYYGPD